MKRREGLLVDLLDGIRRVFWTIFAVLEWIPYKLGESLSFAINVTIRAITWPFRVAYDIFLYGF